MPENTAAGLCRLTVRAPEKSIDLAVPADIPIIDLLPTLVEYAGDGLAENGLEHGGWVLQRLSGKRLDEESSLDSLGLRDGDTVLLRPHTEVLPEVQLDDLVDGIATTMRDQPFGWTPVISRRLLLAFAWATALAAAATVALSGSSSLVGAVASAGMALLLLAGAGSASRAVGDAGAGAVLGMPGVLCLAQTGWLLPGGTLSGTPEGHAVLGSRLLAAGAAAAGGAMLAVAVVGAFAALFAAFGIIALSAATAGVLVLAADLGVSETAGVMAVTAVIFGAFVPSLSFRLAGLRLPPLPSNAEQLQEGIEPHSPSAVAARAVVADGWMTGLYGAAGVICAASVVGLATHPRLAETLTIAVLTVLLLLHSRGLGNTLQRLTLTAPAAIGVGAVVIVMTAGTTPTGRLLFAAGLLGATATVAIAAWTVPGRRLVPYWGRAAEILHSTMAIAMLPLGLWVLGVYSFLRGLKG
ncbi:type VII secretion integral membrane protein EccD [Streptomyces sp. NPDC050848]|uniref:type VII secretion integral membrane protein EccD n=1 Tax=Streptomyces sp. NPDC050848 TaxID=3155791 RepID=UPI00340DFBC9